MDIENLTIGEAKRLAALFNGLDCSKPAEQSGNGPEPGDMVIVRSRDAGVQYGELVGYEGSTVHLSIARQMWSWTAAQGGTLLDCAQHGVSKGKFSSPCDAVTVIGACAIIATTKAAQKSLGAQKWTS